MFLTIKLAKFNKLVRSCVIGWYKWVAGMDIFLQMAQKFLILHY